MNGCSRLNGPATICPGAEFTVRDSLTPHELASVEALDVEALARSIVAWNLYVPVSAEKVDLLPLPVRAWLAAAIVAANRDASYRRIAGRRVVS